MIIQIRGTSGSGKSTVMRQIMESLGEWKPWYVEGRKRPMGYNGTTPNGYRLAVLGHYDSPCGGGDTIGSAKAIYEAIQTVKADAILCEGLLLSEDSKWSSQLEDLWVVFLATPLDTCLNRIRSRRDKVGNSKPLNPHNTENRIGVIERARLKLLDRGIRCRRASSEQAAKIVLEWLESRFDFEL